MVETGFVLTTVCGGVFFLLMSPTGNEPNTLASQTQPFQTHDHARSELGLFPLFLHDLTLF